jgi:hypothetical protein
LIEREVFLRYHIGRSLLPSCQEIADRIGALELIEKEGFQRKPGASLEGGRESWSLDFGELRGRHTDSFKVERSRFDHLLLRHAPSQGKAVDEGVEVQALDLDQTGRPCHTYWAGGEQRELQEKNAVFFDHVEGLGALDVVDRLYVTVQPRLGSSHIQAGLCRAASS